MTSSTCNLREGAGHGLRAAIAVGKHAEITGFYTPGDHTCTFRGRRVPFRVPDLHRGELSRAVAGATGSRRGLCPLLHVLRRPDLRGHRPRTRCRERTLGQHRGTSPVAPAGPSAVVGPHGYLLQHARSDGPDVICVDLDRTDPALDVALNKARPWRDTARAGDIYAAALVSDPRSVDRTGT